MKWVGNSLKSRNELIRERKDLLKKAKIAEHISNFRDAIINYQLIVKISEELGEFENARSMADKIRELKRRSLLIRKKSLERKKIEVDETKTLMLSQEARRALEIAVIAEGEQRWSDAIQWYRVVVEKNYEMGDFERAKAFEKKLLEIKRCLNKI